MTQNATPRAPAERVGRACDACSRSKSKCLLRSGSQVCENCNFLHLPCTFTREVRKRGPRKGYVSSLEDRLARLEHALVVGSSCVSDNGNSDNNTVAARVVAEKTSVTTDDGHPRSLKRRASLDDSASTSSATSEVSDVGDNTSHAIAQTSSNTDASETSTMSSMAAIFGRLSIDENLTMRYHGSTSGLYLVTSSRIFSSPFWYIPNPGFWPQSTRMIVRTEDEIVQTADTEFGRVLPTEAVQDELLNAYWIHVHPCFPIIHKKFFLTQLANDRAALGTDKSALDQLQRRIPQVLLLAMFALAARFIRDTVDVTDSHVDGEPGDYSDSGDMYAVRAESLIAQHKQPTLSCCMALLLMGFRELGVGGSVSWMYIGSAIRMAQDLGLHRDPTVWPTRERVESASGFASRGGWCVMSPTEIQVRRLLWYGVYVADKYTSAWHGRPNGIVDADFDTVVPLVDLDDEDDGLALLCFVQMIKLSAIQSKIYSSLFALKPAPDITRVLAEIDCYLADWESQLPPALKLDPMVSTLRQSKVPSSPPAYLVALHAQFWNCRILLHRPALDEQSTKLAFSRTTPAHLATSSSALAISNLVRVLCSHASHKPGSGGHDICFKSPFLNYYIFTAAIAHAHCRMTNPLLFPPAALAQCVEGLRTMGGIWPAATRSAHIILGLEDNASQPEHELLAERGDVIADRASELVHCLAPDSDVWDFTLDMAVPYDALPQSVVFDLVR
ncbi:putative nitrogen assimilation transcription factor nit-4 [Limtongia smithiae]|uniref:putative nitrogen assimilation transcription factor nit-4 n=1 Tax=Limtongia smithiae TaxID=1125753 RepID=UPI0034CF9590